MNPLPSPIPSPILSLALAVVVSSFLGTRVNSANFTAVIEPEVIALGSAATLQLRFEDCNPSDSPTIPDVPGLRFTHVGRGSEMTMAAGRVSQNLVISYHVTAAQAGTYTIPPITATVNGRRVATSPLTLTVAPTDPALARVAFLTLAFPKNQYYVGESTAAEIHLHAQAGTVARLPTLSGDGALFGTNVSLGQAVRVATNNGIYQRLAWRVPVTFAKTGQLPFAAQDCQLRIEVRSPPRGGSLWSLLPEVETRTLSLSSDPLTLEILPLPSDAVPPDFSGAVGRFNLRAEIANTNVALGDPLTLTVRIVGHGNLSSVRWSAPESWTGLSRYDPMSRLESADPLGLSGTRVFEQVLIPESTDVRAIPPLQFSYFDPTTASYQSVSHPGFPLAISAVNTAIARPIVAAPSTIPRDRQPTELAHIKNRPGTLAVVAPPLLAQPWFLGLQLLPLLAWAGSALLRRRQQYFALNPQQLRRARAGRQLHRGLALLRAHLAAAQSQAFYHTLHQLLQEQLSAALDLPASAISADIIEQRLRPANLDRSLVDAVEQLFRHCDLARYAPSTRADNLEPLLTLAQDTFDKLRALSRHHAL